MIKSTTPLKRLLEKHGIRQAHLARDVGVSPGTLADAINHGQWPRKSGDALQRHIAGALHDAGASPRAIKRALEAVPATKDTAARSRNARGNEASPDSQANPARGAANRGMAAQAATSGPQGQTRKSKAKEQLPMLLQKQTLTPQARAHFKLAADPFVNDIREASDVFVTPDIRYVRETLWQHARHGGLLAVVGESGSGKSTVVADFKDRLLREGRDVLVIEPSVLYMEENDSKGKTLKSAAIVQAIIATVAPSEAPRRDAEARARQVHKLLTAGHRAGQRHVLLIEEAHCLPTATLKHLKRFAELKDGLAPLLSIVLVGQPELRQRLAVTNAEVREVAQRCDIVELCALGRCLSDYIEFKLKRIGADPAKVISKEGIEALRERLTFARRTGDAKGAKNAVVSLAYPLAVANALTAAMNLAASLGAPVVDADIAKEA